MLTPEDLAEMPAYVHDLFEDYDDFVIRDFTRRIAKAGRVTSTADWQAWRAREWGIGKTALGKELDRVQKLAEEGNVNILTEAFDLSNTRDAERFEAAGIFAERVLSSENLGQFLEAAIRQTNGEMRNMTRTMGVVTGRNGQVSSLTDTYIRSMDLAQLQVSSGVLDYRTAIKNAVKVMADSGIQSISYGDSGKYHMNIASAARMCTLTGLNQMASKMTDKIADDLGLDLVEVSAHAGARPSHAVWQGGIYSRSGKSPDYEDLYAATGLGEVDGLCGANCRHTYYSYMEGSPRSWTPEKLASLDPDPVEVDGKEYSYYEVTQRQRQMERQIRATKRELIGFNEVPELRDDFVASSVKLSRQRLAYRVFCEKAGVAPKPERTQEYKYGRSISSKAVWANRKRA